MIWAVLFMVSFTGCKLKKSYITIPPDLEFGIYETARQGDPVTKFDQMEAFIINRATGITMEDIESVRLIPDQMPWFLIVFHFNEKGAARFSDLSEKNIDKPLVFAINEVAYSSPMVMARIESQGWK